VHILTTRADLTPAEIRHRMGSRWRQENHCRYARIHFDLDSHDGYRTTGDDPDRMVPNPAKKTAYAQVEKARRAMHSAETTSDAAHPAHPARPTARATPHRRHRPAQPSPQRHPHQLPGHQPHAALQHQIPPVTAHELLSHVRMDRYVNGNPC